MRLRLSLAIVATTAATATALAAVPTASAEIIITPPAQKVCVGHQGGGINLRLGLNHGDKPSRRFWFRTRLYNPSGRLVHSFRHYVWSTHHVDGMTFTPYRLGVYRTVFEAFGWQRRVFRTRVFPC
jgi:hypothetical protein